MPVRVLIPFQTFYSAVDSSPTVKTDATMRAYKHSVGECAKRYIARSEYSKITHGNHTDWWRGFISPLAPKDPKSLPWSAVCNITRDNVAKLLQKGGSSAAYAVVLHQGFHLKQDRRARLYARYLDRLAFGEPAETFFGRICEHETTSLLSEKADALAKANKGKLLAKISNLNWLELPEDAPQKELSLDITFDTFEEEIGEILYMYGAREKKYICEKAALLKLDITKMASAKYPITLFTIRMASTLSEGPEMILDL